MNGGPPCARASAAPAAKSNARMQNSLRMVVVDPGFDAMKVQIQGSILALRQPSAAPLRQ
jgi:hypothetical protein